MPVLRQARASTSSCFDELSMNGCSGMDFYLFSLLIVDPPWKFVQLAVPYKLSSEKMSVL